MTVQHPNQEGDTCHCVLMTLLPGRRGIVDGLRLCCLCLGKEGYRAEVEHPNQEGDTCHCVLMTLLD